MCLPLTFFLPNENGFVALPRGDIDLLLDLLFANENNVRGKHGRLVPVSESIEEVKPSCSSSFYP